MSLKALWCLLKTSLICTDHSFTAHWWPLSITELCLSQLRAKFYSVKNITAWITKEKEKRGGREAKTPNRIFHLEMQVCGNKLNTDKFLWMNLNFRKHGFLTSPFLSDFYDIFSSFPTPQNENVLLKITSSYILQCIMPCRSKTNQAEVIPQAGRLSFKRKLEV